MSGATKLNAAQRAWMRDWLSHCIALISTNPPTAHRENSLATLRLSLERYSEPPKRPALRLIAGGRK